MSTLARVWASRVSRASLREERGQTAAELLGVILVVAALLAAVAATGVGATITTKIELALCSVAGGDCRGDSRGTEAPDPPDAEAQDPGDLDGDGISNAGERELGTDPNTADSDGDGLPDGQERDLKTDPGVADTDGDGLPDAQEVDSGGEVDARDADSDDDGLSDGEEAAVETDPSEADGDGESGSPGDGLTDAEEVERYGTDPNAFDTDGDGLPDGYEVDEGSDPRKDERNLLEKGLDAFLDDPFTLGRGTVIKGGGKKIVDDLIGKGKGAARRIGGAKSIDEAAKIRGERLDALRKRLADKNRTAPEPRPRSRPRDSGGQSNTRRQRLQENKRNGDRAADDIAGTIPGSRREVSRETRRGTRRIDVLTPDGRAIESKIGRTANSKSVKEQIAKDVELRRANDDIEDLEWRFGRSPTTGKCGPTKPLREALEAADIEIVEDC